MVVDLSDEGRRGTYGEGDEETELGLNNVQQRRIMADDLKNRYGKSNHSTAVASGSYACHCYASFSGTGKRMAGEHRDLWSAVGDLSSWGDLGERRCGTLIDQWFKNWLYRNRMRKEFSGRVAEMVGGGRARLDCYDAKGMAGSGFGVGVQYEVQFALLWVRKKIGGGRGKAVGSDRSQFLQAWVRLLQGGGTYPRWRICDYSLLTTSVRSMIFAILRMIPIPYKSLIFI